VSSEEKRLSKRKEILQATLDTVHEDKISGTRMREIAKRAGMSQGNLHYYYPAKDELFLALLDYLLEIFVDEREDILANSEVRPLLKLSFFLRQDKELILRRKEMDVFMDFWVQGTKDPKIREKIQSMYARWRHDIGAVVEEGVQAGLFSPKHAQLIPSLLISIMDGAALQHLLDEEAFDLDAYFFAAYEMVVNILVKPQDA